MRRLRTPVTCLTVSALALTLAACGGGTSTEGGSNDSPKKLTYWASNQGPSPAADRRILRPVLDRFEERTGIEVELEVVPWDSLLDRILAAASSGQGPDVLNIGSSWTASLQASDALLPWNDERLGELGGRQRFVDSALASTGAPGKDPAAVPLYSLAYALYYNKAMFAEAGIDQPPSTWAELVAAGKKLSGDGKWGLGAEGANPSTNIHQTFVLAKQHGAEFFDEAGRPQFTSAHVVQAVKQYVDLMARDKVIAPGNSEYAQNQSLEDFAKGRTAMVLWQAAATTFSSYGMQPDEWGAAPVPVPAGKPGKGKQTNSMVAGINIGVFKDTDNIDGALKFVKFMTSDPQQVRLNRTYGSIPPVRGARSDKAFDGTAPSVLRTTLEKSAAPPPQVPEESQFETAVGTAVKELFADAAGGRRVTDASVRAKLAKAQQQLTNSR